MSISREMNAPGDAPSHDYAPSHLVAAKIAEARARGALDDPSSDEARVLAEMERLLEELSLASDEEALELKAQLGFQERMLAHILERTGQAVLADVLWEDNPSYDLFC
jgi:hypothetical protein